MLRLPESGVGRLLVTEHQAKADIPLRTILPHFGRAILRGIFEIHQGRQRLIIDFDQLGGIACLCLGFGDDEGHAVADEAHFFSVKPVSYTHLTLPTICSV